MNVKSSYSPSSLSGKIWLSKASPLQGLSLARVSVFMNPDKLRLLMNSFIKSQFSYCPLIWMFHDRGLNAKVNKIQERTLRIVYKNSHADYESLLKLDNTVPIHQRNLQYLMIEIYKTKKSLNPSFMGEIFEARDVQYDLRNKNNLGIPNAKTTSYGIETVRYLGQKLWQTLPHNVRESQSLTAFKKELRTCAIGCDCRLCKTLISGLGFIWHLFFKILSEHCNIFYMYDR